METYGCSANALHSIETRSGRFLDPFDTNLADIDIEDIASGLSMLPRFAGQTRWPYPVAAHSCMVHDLVEPEHRLAALLHDAAEAYIGDLARPIKIHEEMAGYRGLDGNLSYLIAQKFNFVWPLHPSIKVADNVAMNAEARVLKKNSRKWNMDPSILLSPAKMLKLQDEVRYSLDTDWRVWYWAFLDRFYKLSSGI